MRCPSRGWKADWDGGALLAPRPGAAAQQEEQSWTPKEQKALAAFANHLKDSTRHNAAWGEPASAPVTPLVNQLRARIGAAGAAAVATDKSAMVETFKMIRSEAPYLGNWARVIDSAPQPKLQEAFGDRVDDAFAYRARFIIELVDALGIKGCANLVAMCKTGASLNFGSIARLDAKVGDKDEWVDTWAELAVQTSSDTPLLEVTIALEKAFSEKAAAAKEPEAAATVEQAAAAAEVAVKQELPDDPSQQPPTADVTEEQSINLEGVVNTALGGDGIKKMNDLSEAQVFFQSVINARLAVETESVLKARRGPSIPGQQSASLLTPPWPQGPQVADGGKGRAAAGGGSAPRRLVQDRGGMKLVVDTTKKGEVQIKSDGTFTDEGMDLRLYCAGRVVAEPDSRDQMAYRLCKVPQLDDAVFYVSGAAIRFVSAVPCGPGPGREGNRERSQSGGSGWGVIQGTHSARRWLRHPCCRQGRARVLADPDNKAGGRDDDLRSRDSRGLLRSW